MLDRRTVVPRDRVLELVKKIVENNSIIRAVSMDHQLTESGLSSIDMVNLMLAIEAEFDIMIPASDISPANFRSISTIEALIVKILGSLDRES
jgi:acyl carrier protein